jgi:DnaK suppressor protein
MAKTPYSKKELDEFKTLLQDKRSRVLKDIVNQQNTNHESSLAMHGDAVDVATGYLEKELSISLSNTDKEILDLIDQALLRIEDKIYGICIDTGEVIGKNRLKAMPEAARTLTAQEKMDRKNRKKSTGAFRR